MHDLSVFYNLDALCSCLPTVSGFGCVGHLAHLAHACHKCMLYGDAMLCHLPGALLTLYAGLSVCASLFGGCLSSDSLQP